MNCPGSSPVRRGRGAALVVAMLVFALATTLVVALGREFTLFIKRGSNSFLGEQAWTYLLGGEELAAAALRDDLSRDGNGAGRDDLTEPWARDVPPYSLDEGGWLVGSLEDLQGRFNVNSVAGRASGGGRFTAAQEQFVRLLQTPEEPIVSEQEAMLITEALVDWLDADSRPRDFGAEDQHYYGMTPSYRAANRPLLSVSELRLVANMTPEIFNAVAPYLTVWGDGTINVHTAPAPVLRTLNSAGTLSPLSEQEGEALAALREGDDGLEDLQALLDSPALKDKDISPELRGRLGESSGWFLYAGEIQVAGREARLYSVLRRQGRDVRSVVRSGGAI